MTKRISRYLDIGEIADATFGSEFTNRWFETDVHTFDDAAMVVEVPALDVPQCPTVGQGAIPSEPWPPPFPELGKPPRHASLPFYIPL